MAHDSIMIHYSPMIYGSWIMSNDDSVSWMNDKWIINNDEWLSHNSIMIYPWYMVFWIMSDDDADSWMNQ